MSHYDQFRVKEWAERDSCNVTEQDRKKLIKAILNNGGVLCLFIESPDWPWPIVERMLMDKDHRIKYDPEGGGYKVATIEINALSETERTKILLS